MKRGAILFLRVVVLLFGVGVLAGMRWEPQVERVNAHSDQITIYLRDPFLAYAYLGSLPFFFVLYQAFQLLGYVGRGEAFSPISVRAVRHIKHCALAVIAFIFGGEIYIILGVSDDHAGGVAMGVMLSFICVVTATVAAVLERVLANGVDLRSENELTV